jgi:ubiquitin carboxyl-terminal hydrolase 34
LGVCETQGVDAAYDAALFEYYDPYHHLIDLLVRVAVNQQCLSENLVNLSATVACEGVPLHTPYFAKLWYEIYMSESVDRRYVDMLCAGAPFIDYVATVLLEERTSLNTSHIHQFFCNFFNKV